MASAASIRTLRRHLHANPYAANNEGWTAAAIFDFLRSHGVEATHTKVNGGEGMLFSVVGLVRDATCATEQERDRGEA
jgi:metal-dependent amidase/aminoacylase/carboxypeptidase family protein